MRVNLPEKALRTLFAGFLITFSALLFPSLAILPEIPFGTGGYYVFPNIGATLYITAIYNNTEVCTDDNKNLICESWERYVINSGKYITTAAQIVFTDKPAIVSFKGNPWNSGCICPDRARWGYGYGGYVVSSQMLGSEYYVPYDARNVYITATQYHTEVNITNSSGTFTFVLNNPSDYIELSSPEPGAKINADKPVSVIFKSNPWNSGCTCSYGIWGYGYGGNVLPSQFLSTEYYVPYDAENVYITATQNLTKVEIDQNRDGIADETYEINITQYIILSNPVAGARINSDKPVIATFTITWNSGCGVCGVISIWGYGYGGFTPSFQLLGTEYIIPAEVEKVSITPIQYSTRVTITNSSGTFIFNLVSPSDYLILTNPEIGTKISANKPVIVIFNSNPWHSGCKCGAYDSGIWGYAYGGEFYPLSPSTIIQTPGLIGLNEYGTIKVRLFNPTSEILYNISIDVYIPKNFTLVGDIGVVNVTVYKKNAHTDSIIASDFVQKSYSLSGEENVFTVSYGDSNLLSSLGSDEYIELEFEVISNSPGYYAFKAQSTWKATHWV